MGIEWLARCSKSVGLRVLALLIVAVASSGCAAVSADAGKPESKAATVAVAELSEHIWYDGVQPRTAWLHSGQVADFSGQLKSVVPAAAVLATRGGVTIYSLNDAAVSKASAAVGTSPVFYENAGGQGRRRALPGNVIAEFDAGLDRAAVERWAESARLKLLRKLNFGNFYVIESPAGLASLELANRLQASGEVKSAQPDWWVEAVTR